jgi:hypothetical protein
MEKQKACPPDEIVLLSIGIRFGDKGGAHVYKPSQALNADRYSIVDDNIFIKQGEFPVYLLLESEKIIEAIGFSKSERRWVRPRMHKKPGPCGGCFTYEEFEVLPPAKIVAVRNDGVDYEPGYTWWIWVDDGQGGFQKIDPRVYNHGETEHPPARKPGIFLRLWQLLFGKG